MGDTTGKKPKGAGWGGCAVVLLLVLAGGFPFLINPLKEQRVQRAAQIALAAPTSTTLSSSDVQTLVPWLYAVEKMHVYVDDCASQTNCMDDIISMNRLISIMKTLPTSNKYRPLTDSIAAALQERTEWMSQGANDMHLVPDETVNLMENIADFAGDVRYVSDKVPQDEKNRILDPYFGKL